MLQAPPHKRRQGKRPLPDVSGQPGAKKPDRTPPLNGGIRGGMPTPGPGSRYWRHARKQALTHA
eukprot:6267196-Lingulodinium_polyedra.AAC.1